MKPKIYKLEFEEWEMEYLRSHLVNDLKFLKEELSEQIDHSKNVKETIELKIFFQKLKVFERISKI